jgi:hypothetical protein
MFVMLGKFAEIHFYAEKPLRLGETLSKQTLRGSPFLCGFSA